MNHEIPDELQKLGYPILTVQSLPLDEHIVRPLFQADIDAGFIKDPFDVSDVWKNSYSENTNQKVWAAKFTARHPNLVALELSSFKCGHDAPIYTVIEEIVENSGTPYFSFKDIDENKPTGSIKIRIETIGYFLKRYQEDMRKRMAKEQRVEVRLAEYQAELLRRIEAAQARLAHEQASKPDVVLEAAGLLPRPSGGGADGGPARQEGLSPARGRTRSAASVWTRRSASWRRAFLAARFLGRREHLASRFVAVSTRSVQRSSCFASTQRSTRSCCATVTVKPALCMRRSRVVRRTARASVGAFSLSRSLRFLASRRRILNSGEGGRLSSAMFSISNSRSGRSAGGRCSVRRL
jgi:hypothetical protein